MKTFKHLINEALKFSYSKDDDYYGAKLPYDKSFISLTDWGECQYRIEGLTAGVHSHALKHLDAFDKPFLKKAIKQTKDIMIEYVKQENHDDDYKVTVRDVSGKPISGTDEKKIKNAPQSAVINYLDYLNDQVILKRTPTKFEKVMLHILDAIADRYSECVVEACRDSINLDHKKDAKEVYEILMNRSKVNFSATNRPDRDAVARRLFLDIPNHITVFCDKREKEVRTAYKQFEDDSEVGYLAKLYKYTLDGQHSKIDNPAVEEAFKEIAKPTGKFD